MRPPAAERPPTVLVVAGLDPSGGAGLSSDLRTLAARGIYAGAVPTVLTLQTTRGVRGQTAVAPEVFRRMLRGALEDLRPGAIKIGLLGSTDQMHLLAGFLRRPEAPLSVLDPVLVSTSGYRFLPRRALPALRTLLQRVTVLTPNRMEAEALAGVPVRDVGGMIRAALLLQAAGPRAVVVKGGHMEGQPGVDVVFDGRTLRRLSWPRLRLAEGAHGLGCLLSSAIAAELALGEDPLRAVLRADRWVRSVLPSGLLRPGRGRLVPFPFKVSRRAPTRRRSRPRRTS